MTERSEGEGVLAGRVALVTGAAKRIGRAVALRLAREGADVIVHYGTSRELADDTAREIRSLGRSALVRRGDLQRLPDIERLVAAVHEHFGRLDILVNNAALFLPAGLEFATEAQWDATLDTNLKAQFFCAQAAAPLLKKSGRGVIINFASLGGLLAWPGYIPYCVSKAGVIMLTRCLAKALAPKVRVNAVAPGTISMPGDPPEWETDYIRLAPLGRTGTPEDIASAVSFLIHSDFITGQVLVVDGGRSL
ncbi:MAG: SDR family oxidoreductase [Candidatus Acidiferrales bacterium]|jgi:NAD(P)-dependent dehydrogenase (short-subunit alcohol dehydrogenase family)